MKMIKYIYIILSVLFFSSCQIEIRLNQEQKNADAVYLTLSENFHLKETGEQEYINSSRMLLQTHASFNRLFGDSHIDYDPRFQKVKIIKADTENSMGKSTVKENAINDILPKNAQKSSYYNSLRTKVVSHMGTEIGSVVNFDYSIVSNADYKPGLFENIVIGKTIPVKDYELVINIPKGKKLEYKLFNSEIIPTIEETKIGKTYKWKFSDIPAVRHEKNEPQYRNDVIRLVFSTLSETECTNFIKSNMILTSGDSIIEDISRRSTQAIKKDIRKILKLQEEVSNNIAFNNISFSQASYRGRVPNYVWESLGGNSYEKTFLLSSLINGLKFKSDLVVSVPADLVEFAKTNPDVWQDFYVYLDSINNGLLLTATKENQYSMHFQEISGVLYNPISGKVITVQREPNSIDAKINFNINSRKVIWGDADIKLSGLCWHNLKESDFGYTKSLFKFSLKYNKLSDRNYFYYFEDKAKVINSNYFSITLPEYRTGFISFNCHLYCDSRNAPLKLKSSLNEKYKYSLTVNDKFRLINKPVEIEKKNKIGKAILRIIKLPNKIEIERELKIDKSIITVNEYPLLKDLIDLWTDINYKELYFTNAN